MRGGKQCDGDCTERKKEKQRRLLTPVVNIYIYVYIPLAESSPPARRVMGELAVSRAFGDRGFKEPLDIDDSDEDGSSGKVSDKGPLVTAEPEITEVVLAESDEFVLLACDGLFDVFTSTEAVQAARKLMVEGRGDPARVAATLADEAIVGRRSRDNVSVLIVVLRPFWED